MFVLPLILVPIVFLMALARLYQIPAQLRSGRLKLVGRGRAGLCMATLLAYAGLLAGSGALLAALVYASFFAADRWSAYLHLAPYLALYPLLYLAAAWVFYYGLKKPAAD